MSDPKARKGTAKAKAPAKAPTKAKAPAKVARSRKAIPTIMAIIASVAKAGETRKADGVKANYAIGDRFAKAIHHAFASPSLTDAGVSMGRSSVHAKARRDHAKAIGAKAIPIASVIHANMEGEIKHDRPENTLRSRLQIIARDLGLPADTLVAVRAKAYAEGEVPSVYIVRR